MHLYKKCFTENYCGIKKLDNYKHFSNLIVKMLILRQYFIHTKIPNKV